MTQDQRDSLVSRIIAGYLECKLRGKIYHIYGPTASVRYQSQLVYDSILENYKYANWLRQDRCEAFLVSHKLWEFGGDKSLIQLNTRLEDFKVDLFKARLDNTKVDKIRKRIRNLRKQIDRLYIARHAYDHFTLEGFAETIRQQYIVACLTYCNGEKFLHDGEDWTHLDHRLLYDIANYVNEQRLNIVQLRELARNEPWSTYWRVDKNPFNERSIDLDDERRMLIHFSYLYENVREHPEYPGSHVADDDDMFDGWMIMVNRQATKERETEQIQSLIGDKHSNAQEVFIPTNDPETIRKINELNSPRSRIIKAQRAQLVKQKGEIKDADLPDRKLEKQMQAVRQHHDTIKRNK
jgi:hypothetical protein